MSVFSLADSLGRVAGGGEADPAVLEALARKIDVAKRVHAFYDAQLAKPASDELLDAGRLPQLCTLLLREAERRADLKLLNSALKLRDALPAAADAALLDAWIDRLLTVPLPACSAST